MKEPCLTPTPFPFLAQATAPSAAPTPHTAVTAAPGTTAPASSTPPAKEPPFWASPMVLPLFLIAIFFIFMSRTKKKQEREAQDLRNNLKRGDRIQTIGGILGTVVEARDTEVLVKVDETNNTKIRFSRNAIHRVIVEETAAADKK
jgi:preprotein translocase subunit YajC